MAQQRLEVRGTVTFGQQRGEDGKVRAGVWDYICVPGHDEKDGQSTDFDEKTLSQMIDNFVDRGDPIPLDANHQSNYSHINGQPAPALAWYSGLALVWDGKIVKQGWASGQHGGSVEADGLNPAQCDLSRPGLWGFRSEVTEYGQQYLPSFKLLSPTFMAKGTKRDGTECGYCLAAVAATNTPWQGGTEITFEQKPAGTVPADKGATKMAKLAKLAKFASMDEGAEDSAIKAGLAKKMADTAACAMSDETFDYEGSAKQFDEAASAYDDAHMEDDGEAPSVAMRKMAAKFRRMSKLDATETATKPAPAASETEAGAKKMAAETEAKMSTMSAALTATQTQLAKLQAKETARENVAATAREAEFSALADAAVRGGYPADARESLIAFARFDRAGAEKSVAAFIQMPTGAPAHLFDRMSAMGGPLGGDPAARPRAEFGPPKPRVVTNNFGRFIEVDSGFADEIKKTAEAKDELTMSKVDKLLPETHRAIMFHRLQAAAKVVRAERPDLADAADAS